MNNKNNLLFVMILLLIPVSGLGIDIYVPSLPAIKVYFDAPHFLIKLTIALYLLGFGLGQIFVGTLSDCFGRRIILIAGLFLFSMFSVLAAFSTSIIMLLAVRFCQGLAVTVPVVISKTIATDTFKGADLKKVSTYLVTAWSIGPIIAPAIGGYLQQYVNWKGSFYFLAVYTIILCAAVCVYLPETNQFKKSFKLKNMVNDYKIILSSKQFVGSALCLATGYSLIVVFSVISPFLIQNDMGYSPVCFGHCALLMGFGCLLGSIINRLIVVKTSQDKIILCAVGAALFMSILMIALSCCNVFNIYCLLMCVFVVLLSVGFSYPNCSSKCLSMFPQMAGSASAAMGVLTIIGTSVTAAVSSFIHTTNMMALSVLYLILCLLFLFIFLNAYADKFAFLKIANNRIEGER